MSAAATIAVESSARAVRVLYVIDAMAHGGTEKQLVVLLRGLDRARFEPLLVTLRPSSMDLDGLGCPVRELRLGSFLSPAAFIALRALRRHLQRERIDVMHTFFQDATVLGGLAAAGLRHCAPVASFRDLGFWRTPMKVWQLRRLYPWFDGFTANSEAVATYVCAADGLPRDRIEVIPNGVRIPATAAALSAGRTVGIIANLNREVKRVDLFIDAAAIVKRAVPDARFTIIGDGHLRPALEARAEGLGLRRAVRFAGLQPDVAAELAGLDVGVLSSDSEGFSNAILEYMAVGLPVVARRVGGNAEAVVDGETGFLVDGDSPAALATPIVRLLEDAALRARCGAAGRRLALERYSLEAYVGRHEALYTRLVAERRAGRRFRVSAGAPLEGHRA